MHRGPLTLGAVLAAGAVIAMGMLSSSSPPRNGTHAAHHEPLGPEDRANLQRLIDQPLG